MAERTDIAMQSFLDSLSQVPGSILYRDRREWRALAPGEPQSVLAYTEEAGIHWSLDLAGAGVGPTELTPSHDWTGNHDVEASGRAYGNVYEIGPDPLEISAIEFWGRTFDGWFECSIYRDSDTALIAQVAIKASWLEWKRQPIEPITLDPGTRYVFQHLPIPLDRRNVVNNVEEFNVHPSLTFIEGRKDWTSGMATTPDSKNYPQVRVAF